MDKRSFSVLWAERRVLPVDQGIYDPNIGSRADADGLRACAVLGSRCLFHCIISRRRLRDPQNRTSAEDGRPAGGGRSCHRAVLAMWTMAVCASSNGKSAPWLRSVGTCRRAHPTGLSTFCGNVPRPTRLLQQDFNRKSVVHAFPTPQCLRRV